MVGRDAAATKGVGSALERLGVHVGRATPADVVALTRSVAPELVAAIDDAGPDARAALDGDVLTRGTLFETLTRGSDEARADALMTLATSLPERATPRLTSVRGSVSEQLERTIAAGACGIFSVRDALRGGGVVVAGAGAKEALPALADRLEPIAAAKRPVEVSFHAASSHSLHDLRGVALGSRASLEGLRVVVLAENALAVQELELALVERGAQTVMIEPGGTNVGRARALAPDVIVADEALLDDAQGSAMTALRGDVRLAWASILAVPSALVSPRGASSRDYAQVALGIKRALALDAEVTRLAHLHEPVSLRFEGLGPLRLLRALVRAGGNVQVTVRHAVARVEVELEDGRVVGAQARGRNGETDDGHSALATLLTFPSGRVRIGRASESRLIDVMAPLDDALAVAFRERARIKAPARAADTRLESSREDARAVIEALRAIGAPPRPVIARFSTAKNDTPPAPPPGAMAPPEDPRPIAPAPSEDASAPTLPPIPGPAPVPNEARVLTPLAAASEVRPPPRAMPWGRMAIGAAIGGAATLGLIAVVQSGGHEAPVVAAAPGLAADFDAVEAQAEEDVPEEDAADTARAIAEGTPPAPPPVDQPQLAPPPPGAILDGPTIDGMIQHGNYARHMQQWDVAIRYFDDVIASDPTNGRALAGLTRTYQERGDLANAARVARLMLDAHPDHPANFVLLADLLEARGDRDGARAVLEDVCYRFPRYEPAHERLDDLRHRPHR